MAEVKEFAMRVEFRHDSEGRCYISSPDLPGLHLAGDNMEILRGQLDKIIRDLARHNLNISIGRLRWVPSLDEVTEKHRHFLRTLDAGRTEVCVMELAAA